jgi:hypothetical protein
VKEDGEIMGCHEDKQSAIDQALRLLRLRVPLLRVNGLRRVTCLTTTGLLLAMMSLKGVLAVTAGSSMRRTWMRRAALFVSAGMSMLRVASTVTLGNRVRMAKRKRLSLGRWI